MKPELRKGASKVIAHAYTPGPGIRKWSDRDLPLPATRGKAKAEARTSIHFRIVSRTGK
jgi:hypothetical protein